MYVCMRVRASSLFYIPFRVGLEGKPSEIDLDKVSKNVGDKWRSLLTHLGVPLAKCKTLFVESRGDPVSACFEGLVFWREGNEPCRPPTWSVLLEAVEKGAEKRDYAEELRKKIEAEEVQPPGEEYSLACKPTKVTYLPTYIVYF